jgi:type IV secretory pathway VirB10-like protein
MDLHLDLDVKTKRLLRMALALLVVACSAVSDSRTKTMKPNAPPPATPAKTASSPTPVSPASPASPDKPAASAKPASPASPDKPAASAKPASPASPDDQVRNATDCKRKSGTLVAVFGIYQQVAVGQLPNAKPDGHAAVRLSDGTLVHLQPPWQNSAIRSAEELSEYDGQPVVAQGILLSRCPPPPDGRAYAIVTCLFMDIVLLDQSTYDLLHGPR